MPEAADSADGPDVAGAVQDTYEVRRQRKAAADKVRSKLRGWVVKHRIVFCIFVAETLAVAHG